MSTTIETIMQFPKQRDELWSDTARIGASQADREKQNWADFEAAHPAELEQARKLVEALGGERACLRAWELIRQAHRRTCRERPDRAGRARQILEGASVQSAAASNAFRSLQASLVLLVGAGELESLRTEPESTKIPMPKAWDRRG